MDQRVAPSNSAANVPHWGILSAFGVAGLLLSLSAHLATYFGLAIQESVPAVWALHVGIFPLFIPFMFSLRRWQRKRGLLRTTLRWQDLLQHVPVAARVLAIVLFVYAGLNFFLAIPHLPQRGAASTLDAHRVAVYTMRAFSGHWLVFYALPTIYFLFVPERPTAT